MSSVFTAAHVDRLIRETGEAPAVNLLDMHPFFPQQNIRLHHEQLGIVIEGYSLLWRQRRSGSA
jgi:2,5-diketo-D-gluconate reductase A